MKCLISSKSPVYWENGTVGNDEKIDKKTPVIY